MTDEEYLDTLSQVKIYTEVLLGILRYIPIKETTIQEKYEHEIVKKLKTNSYKDVLLLRSCIDILQDTQYAIDDVFKNGLECTLNNFGERYLRLYGVLNSYYQQMFALFNLAKIFNATNQTEIKNEIKSCGIITLRNKIASHTTYYVDDFKNKKDFDFFRVTQTSLTKWSDRLVIVSYKSNTEEIHLRNLMEDFTTKLEKYLFEICKKAIDSIYKHDNENKDWLTFRLNYKKQK